MSNVLSISVAIATFNRNEDLRHCLEALSKQTCDDFDVIIVNGGDYSGVKGIADNFKNLKIKIINQERKGLVEARNLGWQNSQSDIVCIIDDDLVVSSQWIENVQHSFLLSEDIAGVSGPTIIPDDRKAERDLFLFLDLFANSRDLLLKLIGKIYIYIVLENRKNDIGKILKSGAFAPGSNYKSAINAGRNFEVDYLEACHMCFKRKLLEDLNGFDYSYTGTGEWHEPDFSFKARAKGYKLIFNPKVIAYHYISQGGVFKARANSYERSKNFILFYMRWIKPNSLEKIFRLGVHLLFFNLYWCYKFYKSRNPDWLWGIIGTLRGLKEAVVRCR